MGEPEPLKLEWLPGRYAVCRFDADDAIPEWAKPRRRRPSVRDVGAPLVSITRTDRELSIMIDESVVPAEVKAERGFVALRVSGTLEISLVGVLSKLTGALARANIPLFAVSTFDTDYLLIDEQYAAAAVEALQRVAVVDPP